MQRKVLSLIPFGFLAFILATPRYLAAAEASKNVILATTTSTRDSGLLDIMIPVFEKKTRYVVKTVAVGTGKALAMGKRGDADVLMTHAPAAETPLVKDGWLMDRVPFMHNDFILLSRGDNSGTHKKEMALWEKATIKPTKDWHIESGQGMGATLRIADEKDAYTLTDRATYLNLRKTLALEILFEGDPSLVNQYSIMLVNPARHSRVNAGGGRAFHAWVLSAEARDLIRDYGKGRFNQPLFFLDPIK
jgi:tungstate transport system substrate-binding protein